jgi:mono/diheme cytochrome c family protein
VHFLFLTIAWALAAQTQGLHANSAAANFQRGAKLYVSYGCYECHGYEGQGGRAGPRIAPGPIPFSSFSKYLRHPSGQMPPYTNEVTSDQDLSDIYAFLTTIRQPPKAKDISILN